MEKISNENDGRLSRFFFKCDILLLADVFENFRNNSLKNYWLCPSNYLSAPALSWDAMLNMTKIRLELISDPDMCIFFEKGMRGEISYISNRYSKANIIIWNLMIQNKNQDILYT